MKHYITAYRRSRSKPGRLVRVSGPDLFVGSKRQALKNVLDLLDTCDRVCWWTWDPSRGRLRQRL
jgi:hypothetical protein